MPQVMERRGGKLCQRTLIKAHELMRIVFARGRPGAYGAQGDFVVIAAKTQPLLARRDAGAACDERGFGFGGEKDEILFVHRHAQRGGLLRKPLAAQNALQIVGFEDAGQPLCTVLHEIARGHAPALAVVHEHAHGPFQLRIDAIDEHAGDAAPGNFLIEKEIGVVKRGFGAFDDQAVRRRIEDLLKEHALLFDMVVGGGKRHPARRGGKRTLDAAHDEGKDVIGNIGGDDVHAACGRRGRRRGIRSAALTAHDQAFVFQQRDGLTHGLPGTGIAAGERLLGGTGVAAVIDTPQQLLAQRLGEEFVFGQRHDDPPCGCAGGGHETIPYYNTGKTRVQAAEGCANPKGL